MSELENIENVEDLETIPTETTTNDLQENVEQSTGEVSGEVSGEVTEVPEDNSAEIEAEQEKLRREHEEYLNSFPDTTVFYRDLLVDGDVKKLGMATKDPHVADYYKILDNHFDESELTYIGTPECGTYYLKGRERPQPTMQEMIDLKKGEMDAVVQDLLDSTARSKGYTNGAYCVGYVGDPDPEFNAQAVAFRSWRSQVWRKCYQILDAVESGEISLDEITAEYVLSRLPEIEW